MNGNTYVPVGEPVANVKLGVQYPVYGNITAFIEHKDQNNIEIEISNKIKATVNFDSISDIDILKKKAFEPGVFWMNFLKINMDNSTKHVFEGVCNTIVFTDSKDDENSIEH